MVKPQFKQQVEKLIAILTAARQVCQTTGVEVHNFARHGTPSARIIPFPTTSQQQ